MVLQVVKPEHENGTLYHVSTRRDTLGKAVRCRALNCSRVHIRSKKKNAAQEFANTVQQANVFSDRFAHNLSVVIPFETYANRVGYDQAKAQTQVAGNLVF